jgi:hypothetical protein
MTSMLLVGTCSSCGTGNIGVRVSSSGQCVVGLCDECDAVWLTPSLEDGPHFLAQPDLPCPPDGSSLRNFPAHWADSKEAERAGWAPWVGGQTEPLGT